MEKQMKIPKHTLVKKEKKKNWHAGLQTITLGKENLTNHFLGLPLWLSR